ncbi:MAG: LysM peptidoglycan-binding domain-containing protein [Myxococcaceae bacterium]|nr:LysM peptidoglycan-binding domain-containing protein [Myxococcaceae bacterium]
MSTLAPLKPTDLTLRPAGTTAAGAAPTGPTPVRAQPLPAVSPHEADAFTAASAQRVRTPLTITVKRGDTLGQLASHFHVSVGALAKANHIKNANVIFPGQRLTIPGHFVSQGPARPVRSHPAGTHPTKKHPAPPKVHLYTVKRGDTLGSIAAHFHTSVSAIAKRNHVRNTNLIFPGQKLVIGGTAGKRKPGPVHHRPVHGGRGHHASTNRAAIYYAQPNGWTCGPSSLTMAEAAWGVASRGRGTMERLSRAMHVSPDTGVPGNASLVAAQARRDGLHAEFSSASTAAAVRAALLEGKTCVVNGSLSSGGHFIYVGGLDRHGRFQIFDPARPWIHTWSSGELTAFMQHNPGQHPTGFASVWK